MYLTVLILPLLGSLISGLFGRKIGSNGAQIITTLSIIITTLLSIFYIYRSRVKSYTSIYRTI